MKLYNYLISIILLISCSSPEIEEKSAFQPENEKASIHQLLDNWHRAAAEADFDLYFDTMDSLSVFIGTDAEENWDKKAFMEFSKPHFDKGKAWAFTAIERNIYFSQQGDVAWFDELLNTWMGICRGSGVLEQRNGQWKLKHYVLSVTVPNDDMDQVIEAKKEKDSLIIDKMESEI